MMSVTSSALLLNGVCAGSFAFGTAVDTRMLRALANKGDSQTIKSVFSLWWPYGRDWMAPLVGVTTVADGLAFYLTGASCWAAATALVAPIIPWTMFVMGESIQKLRSGEDKEVFAITKKFCLLHHFRTVAAGAALALVVFARDAADKAQSSQSK